MKSSQEEFDPEKRERVIFEIRDEHGTLLREISGFRRHSDLEVLPALIRIPEYSSPGIEIDRRRLYRVDFGRSVLPSGDAEHPLSEPYRVVASPEPRQI